MRPFLRVRDPRIRCWRWAKKVDRDDVSPFPPVHDRPQQLTKNIHSFVSGQTVKKCVYSHQHIHVRVVPKTFSHGKIQMCKNDFVWLCVYSRFNKTSPCHFDFFSVRMYNSIKLSQRKTIKSLPHNGKTNNRYRKLRRLPWHGFNAQIIIIIFLFLFFFQIIGEHNTQTRRRWDPSGNLETPEKSSSVIWNNVYNMTIRNI